MKIKLHSYLQQLLSKHFINKQLPKMVFPVTHPFSVCQASFMQYWNDELSLAHQKQALCFFMEEIVDMVNKTNSRLLYEDLIANIKNRGSNEATEEIDEDKYQLLNVFEMLWNVDQNKQNEVAGQDKNIKGHALTVKEEYLNTTKGSKSCKLIEICEQIRKHGPDGELQCSGGITFLDSSVSKAAKQSEVIFPLQGSNPDCCMLMLDSELAEQTFIKALNPSLISSWHHFEYVLSFIIENRLLRIYQAYEQNKYGAIPTISDNISDSEENNQMREKKKNQNRKKKQAKKTKKKNEAILKLKEKVAARKIQKLWRVYLSKKDDEHSIQEDMAVVDYSFRNEKLFDFTQIEIDKINKNQITFQNGASSRLASPPSRATFTLNKKILSQLDSFSIEEKLSLSFVAFNRNEFNQLNFPKMTFKLRNRSSKSKKSEKSENSNSKSSEFVSSMREDAPEFIPKGQFAFSPIREQSTTVSQGSIQTQCKIQQYCPSETNSGGFSAEIDETYNSYMVAKPDTFYQKYTTHSHDYKHEDKKFFWYLPNLEQPTSTYHKDLCRKFEDIDDISSESSLEDGESKPEVDEYMQQYYLNSYNIFEQQAKQQNYIVDTYNFNTSNTLQQIYLFNQQNEQKRKNMEFLQTLLQQQSKMQPYIQNDNINYQFGPLQDMVVQPMSNSYFPVQFMQESGDYSQEQIQNSAKFQK